MAAAAAAMVQQMGVPPTAENMNRAMTAVMQGTGMTGDNAPVAAAVERTMGNGRAPTGGNRRMRPPAPVPAPVAAVTEEATPFPEEEAVAGDPNTAFGTTPMTRGARVEAGMTSGPRAGTVNGAVRFNEDDADMSLDQMPAPRALPRQADETGVDQTGLALALGAPVAAGVAGAGAAASAGARALRGTMAQRAAAQRGGQLASQARRGINSDRRMANDARGDLPGPTSGRSGSSGNPTRETREQAASSARQNRRVSETAGRRRDGETP